MIVKDKVEYFPQWTARRREDQGDFICRNPWCWIINHGVPKGRIFMEFIV